MAIFRKVDIRLWSDQRFRSLSERGKLLWFYLLTCPETTPLPGVICAGRLHIMEVFGWGSREAAGPFQEVFGGFPERLVEPLGEPLSQPFPEGSLDGLPDGLPDGPKTLAVADWDARLIWLPNATKYNRPDNPNVVRAWPRHWDSVPECPLKALIFQHLRSFTIRLGERFGEAFHEAFPQPCRNGWGNGSPNGRGIQEQEQEQEQEDKESPLKGPPFAASPQPKPSRRRVADIAGEVPVPPGLQTPEFLAAWHDWIADRASRRKPLTERAARQQLAALEAFGAAWATDRLRTAIMNGWTGVVFADDRPGIPPRRRGGGVADAINQGVLNLLQAEDLS